MRDSVNKIMQISNNFIIAGEDQGYLEIINIEQHKVISHTQLEGSSHIYDMILHRSKLHIICCL